MLSSSIMGSQESALVNGEDIGVFLTGVKFLDVYGIDYEVLGVGVGGSLVCAEVDN